MVRADTEAGHGVDFVDTGVTVASGATREDPQVGAVDDRGGFRLVTSPPAVLDHADVLVFHSGVPDAWVVRSQAPIVWILHARPLAAFRLERAHPELRPYSLLAAVASWPRTKRLVSFWPEHGPYWRTLLGEHAGKLVTLEYPPIDLARFCPEGPAHEFAPEHRGEINGLIADAAREDIDAFEVAHGAIKAASRIPGLRWHFYALEPPLGPWEYVIDALRRMGALGELCGRMTDMEQVYRACDLVLTPQRIVTRTIGEAQACGTPVVAAYGCRVADWTAAVYDPSALADCIEDLVQALLDGIDLTMLDDDRSIRRKVRRCAEARYGLERHAKQMSRIYESVAGHGAETWDSGVAEEPVWQMQ